MSENLTEEEQESRDQAAEDLRGDLRAKFEVEAGPAIEFFTSCGISSLHLIEGIMPARESMLSGGVLIEQSGRFYLIAKTSTKENP